MDEFARLPADERQVFFQETANRKGVAYWTVEKDFWVCWMLGLLYSPDGPDSHLVFKGGTSLSKVYGVIDRFSEDIDLSVSPEWLGFTNPPPKSRSGRGKWFKRLQTACSERVKDIQHELEAIARDRLGIGNEQGPCFFFEEDTVTQSPVLQFAYPRSAGTPRRRRENLKLEFGSLTDQDPTGTHPVTPWVAEIFPDAFKRPSCKVRALGAERTFWEKATLLHAYYHFPSERILPARLARHMYDIHCLAGHAAGRKTIEDLGLLARVAEFKLLFFNSGWAHYDTARPGTFHLVPPAARLPEWQRDYTATRDMFIGNPPPFEVLISTLRQIEDRINR